MFKLILSVLLCIVMILSFSAMSFADVEDDLKAFQTVGETVYFGHYEQDNDLSNGKEPIEWIVLEVQDGKSLLLSKYVIDAHPYNSNSDSNIWEESSLRKWLNGSFFSTAFSDTQKPFILLTDVDNSEMQDYSWWSHGGSDNTEDRLFVLSYAETIIFKEQTICEKKDHVMICILETIINALIGGPDHQGRKQVMV